MRKVRVVILDSGVKKSHKRFNEDQIQGYTLYKEGVSPDFEDTYGHGTAIYNIIRKVKDIADITNIKLPDIESGVTGTVLAQALTHISEMQTYDIVNMSLGIPICTDDEYKKLYNACQMLTDQGVILISAFDNDGSISYPAAFPNVIGVNNAFSCRENDSFEYYEDNVVNIGANGNLQRLAWTNPETIFLEGNSFACAHVTVRAIQFLSQKFLTAKQLLEYFRKISVNLYECPSTPCHSPSIPFQIRKAAIFPFNKEMHSLIRYANMLSFTISEIYDVKYSGKVGASVNHLLNDNLAEDKIIKSIGEIDWDAFDTIIIGHLDNVANLINKSELTTNLIQEAILQKKNIYCFDDISQLINLRNKETLFSPIITHNMVPPLRFGKLYRISTVSYTHLTLPTIA